METLRKNAYFQGYMDTFFLYPVGEEGDPWEDTRIAYEEVGLAFWEALHTGIFELEQQTRGTKDERAARNLGKSVREAYQQLTV